MDALNTCSDCHSSDATIVAIEQQFSQSPHGFPQFTMQTRGSCNACHSHNGFVAAASGEDVDVGTGFASLNCRTCHQVHSDVDGDGNFDGADFALATTDPVKLIVADATEPYLDSVVDFSFDGAAPAGSNLCVNCHQARTEDAWPDWEAPLTQEFELGEHYDFHHGPQGNVFVAELPESIEFGETTTDAFNSHKSVSCLGCHMGFGIEGFDPAPQPGGQLSHNFRPSTDVCANCHDADFNYGNVQMETAASLEDLGACLAAEGVITDYDFATHTWEPVFDDDATAAVNEGLHPEPYVAAYLVFAGLMEDGSWGVHQPRYAPDLAQAALDFMAANSAACAAIVAAP